MISDCSSQRPTHFSTEAVYGSRRSVLQSARGREVKKNVRVSVEGSLARQTEQIRWFRPAGSLDVKLALDGLGNRLWIRWAEQPRVPRILMASKKHHYSDSEEECRHWQRCYDVSVPAVDDRVKLPRSLHEERRI